MICRSLLLALVLGVFLPAEAQTPSGYQADVVVVVDTSTSMQQPGMDPERASLLVTKLLSDVVPGRLAVIRLLDLVQDSGLMPTVKTGESGPCDEDRSRTCAQTTMPPSTFEKVRRERAGAEIRPERGSVDFKKRLESHLEQKSNNSMFGIAFLGAQGVFDQNRPAGSVPQFVIWLSDGEVTPNNAAGAQQGLENLKKDGVDVRAIVFGRGSTEFASRNGLNPARAAGPAQLVEAFTDAFRGIMRAPYKVHAPVAKQPQFEMKRWIEEAWVVVYGDTSLGAVEIQTPTATVPANFAQDHWATAGAYKVAYLRNPEPGAYKVRVSGGGENVSYGVVQRSSVTPYLINPSEAVSGVPVVVVACLRGVVNGPEIPEREFGEKVQMTLKSAGQTVTLTDDGRNGDEKAGDGRYSGLLTLTNPGDIPVELTAKNSFLDRTENGSIRVVGYFRCRRCDAEIDFGSLKAGDAPVCQEVPLDAEQQGIVPFELKLRQTLPTGHSLSIEPATRAPNQPIRVCLAVDRHAVSSEAAGQPSGTLAAVGKADRESQIELRMRWTVRELSFMERWGWLIFTLLVLAVVTWIVYGFIHPYRFARELAVSFAPEYGDLDDQVPQPLKQWQDIKSGFYQNARAYFRADFRITGKSTGAIAMLEAGRNRSARALLAGGHSLYWETSDGDWQPVPSVGRRVQNGDVYRVGDRGPHFRIAARVAR